MRRDERGGLLVASDIDSTVRPALEHLCIKDESRPNDSRRQFRTRHDQQVELATPGEIARHKAMDLGPEVSSDIDNNPCDGATW